MALEQTFGPGMIKNGTRFVYASKMNIGEAVTGYLLGFKEGKYPGTQLISLRTEDGATTDVATSGNLRYYQQDSEGTRLTGAFTVITRVADSTNQKTGKPVFRFTVAQDKDRTITVDADAEETKPTTGLTVAERIAKVKAKAS